MNSLPVSRRKQEAKLSSWVMEYQFCCTHCILLTLSKGKKMKEILCSYLLIDTYNKKKMIMISWWDVCMLCIKGIHTYISAKTPSTGVRHLLHLLIIHYVLRNSYLHWIIDYWFGSAFSAFISTWDPPMPFSLRLKSSSESQVFSWVYNVLKVQTDQIASNFPFA